MRVQVLPRPNLSTAITAQLRDMVLNGELVPGAQLPGHRELARMFGVSVTSVREAISALVAAGVLQAHQGRGTFVTADLRPDPGSSTWLGQPIDGAEQTELVEARGVLESVLARLAATRATPEQVKQLLENAAEMQRRAHDAAGYLEADVSFHLTLAEAAHNRVLLRAVYAIRSHLRREIERGLQCELADDGVIHRGVAAHMHLAQAVAARDPQRAERIAERITAGDLDGAERAAGDPS